MIRKIAVMIVLATLAFSCAKKESREIKLALQYHDGYGPFKPSWSILSDQRTGTDFQEDPWLKIYLPV